MSNYLSSIKLPNGDTYEFKDSVARAYHEPIATKTYTNIIATSNDNVGGAFFYLKVRANNWTDKWHVKTKVFATVPGNALYETETYFDIWGYENTYGGYICKNYIRSKSYRPIYYNNYFRIAKTGYDNGCGGWIGFSLYNSTNPLDTSLKRTVTVDLLEYENCTVDFQDSLITPTDIPERATHTDYYSSTNTSFDNFDASGQGIKSSGDNNTTNIANLYHQYGNFIANSTIYRYQLLFHVDDNTLSPLNNNNNVTATTKTLLTDLEFYPFKEIFNYTSTSTINANAVIGASSCFYSMGNVDLRYTFNITTSTLTPHKNVYLKLTPTSGFLAKLASANPLTQDLPASEDGYLYLLLGRAYSGYQISFYPKHPVYYYYNDKVVELILGNTKSTIYYDDTEEKLEVTSSLKVNGIMEATEYNNLPVASTSTAGIVQLNNDITSNSTSTVPTSNTVKKLYDALNGLEVKKKYKHSFIEALNTTEESINNFILYGKTIQNGTPTFSNPIDMVSVGSTNNITFYNTNTNLLVTSASSKTQNGITFTINNDGTIIANGTATAQTILYLYFYLPQGKYCMSGCPSGGSNSTYDAYVYIAGEGKRPPDWDGTSDSLSDYGNGTRFLAENTSRYFVGCRIFTGYTANNVVFKPMITSEENENKDFESYNNNNTISLSLTDELRGIPVSNNGNYTDTNGQQWICDTIDLFNKKYIKRIGVINSSEYTSTYSANTDFIAMKISEEKLLSEDYVEQLSNYGTYVPTVSRVSLNDNTFKLHIPPTNGFTYLYIHQPSTVTSQATLDAWLESHNFIVYYALLNPVITNLTTEQITALQNLHSYNNITNIFTIDECQPEIETSLYTSFSIE